METKIILLIYLLIICIFVSCYWNDSIFPWNPSTKWIKVPPAILEQHIDVITENSLKVKDENAKYIVIHGATYAIFVLNFPKEVLGNIETACRKIKPVSYSVGYTEFDQYPNIQTVIKNSVEQHIVNSERMLVGKKVNDRAMISVYLNRLYEQLSFI